MSSHDDSNQDNGDATMELSLRDVMSFAHTDRSEDDHVYDDDTPPDGIPQAVLDHAHLIVTQTDAEATLERPAPGQQSARTLKNRAITAPPPQGSMPENTVEFDPRAYIQASRAAERSGGVHDAVTSVLSANEVLLATSSWAEESAGSEVSETEHTSTFDVNDALLASLRDPDDEPATMELPSVPQDLDTPPEIAFVGLVDEDGVVRIPPSLRRKIRAGTRVRVTLIPLDD